MISIIVEHPTASLLFNNSWCLWQVATVFDNYSAIQYRHSHKDFYYIYMLKILNNIAKTYLH